MKKINFIKYSLGLLLLVTVNGCGYQVSVPIEKTEYRAGETPARHLVILLGGRGAGPTYFEDHKWVEIARAHGVQVDFVAPYAHFGYYLRSQLHPRLKKDIVTPAKKLGYKSISLLGISMGGLGSLVYSDHFPEDIDRIYLIAPFLGKKDMTDKIRAAGGLANWQLNAGDESDTYHSVWRFLKDMTQDTRRRHHIFLGYGDRDHLPGHDLLADALPIQQVIKIPGNHKDAVFTKIWTQMLEQGFLDRKKEVVTK